MLHSGYQPPNGGLYFTNPRTINDIIFRSLVIRACSIYAHVHLLHLLSCSNRLYLALFAIASTAYPEMILVQLAYNAMRTMILILQRFPTPANVDSRRYYLATLIGADLSSSSTTPALVDAGVSKVEVQLRSHARIPWSIFIWALNLMPLLVTLAGYSQRLGIKYHVATFVGNLGLDHGNAWAAISGSTASVMSLVAILLNSTWSSKGEDSFEVDEIIRKDGSYVERARYQHLTFSQLLAQTLVAALIHHIPLLATNHFALFIHVWQDVWTLSLPLSWALIWYLYGRLFKKGYSLRKFTIEIGVQLVLAPAVIQILSDGNELFNVAHHRVERYNYRWAVKDMVSATTLVKCVGLASQPCTQGRK